MPIMLARFQSAIPVETASGIDLGYSSGKLNAGVAYRLFTAETIKAVNGNTSDEAKIISAGLNYKFDKNLSLYGAYAHNTEADAYDNASRIGIAYKGAKLSDRGSWGASVAYRRFGKGVVFAPTDSTAHGTYAKDQKGVDVMLKYVPFVNTRVELGYFTGEAVSNKNIDLDTLYARVSLFF